MENEAYWWLRDWVESGFYDHKRIASYIGIWSLELHDTRPNSYVGPGFRKDLRQLLADAEAGRKLREGM